MTARVYASAAFSLVLASVAAGCTVHTYSSPGTTYARSEPIRYEVAHRSSDRARERAYDEERGDRRIESRPDSRAASDSKISARDRGRWTARNVRGNSSSGRAATSATKSGRDRSVLKPVNDAQPESGKSSAASRPSTRDKDDAAVTLKPSEPKDKRGTRRVRSFEERLGEVFEQEKAEIAREKKERKAQMERAVSAATAKHR